MEHAEWIWAAVAFGSGLLFGEIAGRIVRSALARRDDVPRDTAGAVGSFVFWASTAVGLVVAIALIDRDVLDDLGERLSDNLPRLLVAFLLLIGGYAVSVAVAAMVGQSARKATGVRQVGLERLLRVAIMTAAVVIALTELGVASSMLVVLLAVGIGAPALAVAGLSALGGRDVAGQIAAGRSLRHQLRPGMWLRAGTTEGTIVSLHPSVVELELPDGARVLVPNRTLLEQPFELREQR
jgi:small-conductance mechanosensitive channel